MWLNETLASGMVPYYHFIGAENWFWRRPPLAEGRRRLLPLDRPA